MNCNSPLGYSISENTLYIVAYLWPLAQDLLGDSIARCTTLDCILLENCGACDIHLAAFVLDIP